MADTATRAPASRHSVEERIGVLEELLGERYSCRAFRPDPVPRADHRAHPDGGAKDRVMVQQPAVAA